MNHKEAVNTLDRYIRARYPVVAVVSYEESRVLSSARRIAHDREMTVATWAFTTGWVGIDGVDGEMTRDAGAAFEALLNLKSEKALYIMLDLHGFLGGKDKGFNPVFSRYLRDVAAKFETCSSTLLLVSPVFQVPTDLEKTISLIDWPLPDVSDLEGILKRMETDLPASVPVTLNGNRDRVIQAMRGLTEFEAASVLLAGVVATRELGDGVIPYIVKEKAQIIRKSGVLEYFDNSVTMQDVGGLQSLKTYAARKRAAFSSQAKAAGVDTPKGVLLVGVPGTGKSLSAKAIAGGQMPLLRMDVGALMGGLVGQSEANMRAALKTAEAIAPCVLWIDEIEKGLGAGGGERDGGTSQRVFGTLLTWMQETIAPVYVVATANDIAGLRPELISRFDDVVFVDLPSQAAREEILKVHLCKRGQETGGFDLPAIARSTWGFSGREIERVVKVALETAFCEGKTVSDAHLLSAAAETVPVSITMKDQIDSIRAWVVTSQARQAGEPLEAKPAADKNSKRTIDF